MTPTETISRCRDARVELFAVGDRLRFRGPAGAITAELRTALAENKSAIVSTLNESCPTCRRPFHDRDRASRQCWKCVDRPCEQCGNLTGSAFIRTCDRCAFGSA